MSQEDTFSDDPFAPSAPSIPSPPPLSTLPPSQESLSTPIKTVNKIACESLSSRNCNKNKNCEYSQREERCIPKNSVTQGSLEINYESYLFKSSILWREGIKKWLQNREEDCNLEDILSNIRVFSNSEKESSSDSIIISGLIHPSSSDKKRNVKSNVIVKASPQSKILYNNQLNVEIAIYKNIISKILNNNYSPNVTSYLGSLSCHNPTLPRSSHSELKNIDEKYYDHKHINFLFLEQSGGLTLKKWLNDLLNDPTLKKREIHYQIILVFFQLIYTLTVFTNLGLSHNDLHFGNIFIERYKKPLSLFFNTEDGKTAIIKTYFIPKIYDFDRGSIYHPAVPRNLFLDRLCGAVGQCATFRPKFDMFSLFVNFLPYLPKLEHDTGTELLHFFRRVTDINWLISFKDKQYGHLLRENVNPTDEQFRMPRTILKTFIEKMHPSPFFQVRETKILPVLPYITFHLPNEMKVEVVEFNPESKENWEAASLPFLLHLPFLTDQTLFRHPAMTIPIVQRWLNEFKDIGKRGERLLKEAWYMIESTNYIFERDSMDNKNNKENIILGLRFVCNFLSCAAIHQLSKQELRDIFSPDVFTLMSHVWNLFDNRLPTVVKKYEMRE